MRNPIAWPSLLLLAWALLLTMPSSAAAQTDMQAEAAPPRLVAALFRSNWCGPCKILEPRYERVISEYADAPLDRVRFDSSFGRRDALADRAREAGIASAYDAASGRTGFVLLIDRETQDVLARITARYSEDDIAGALDYALDIIEDREAFGL
ncbi:thioredoxin domain-containing protein [Oceanicaulis sp. MMSF_3324]|uniref:thioredoxin domain-containing protein n=1 Tax=Oceanicaulis sp. MMSF_3324 TaxID=3046702 RepID=UPI002740260D|nr:thioredoxin domain-containing protein [Oceanicaulis sp. MMSF_3324]